MRRIQQNIISSKLQEEFDVGGSVQIRHGSSVDMKCPATGIPPPIIEWMYDNKKITKENNVFNFKILKGNVLSIPFAEQKHSGIYKCIASSLSGESNQAVMEIDVYGKLMYLCILNITKLPLTIIVTTEIIINISNVISRP